MSACCGQGPVIMNGPVAARVDVETLLLCDVLPDGTVAAQVLVEPVYDTNTGVRVATRTVDPATGDPYTVVGTLGPCPTSPDCAEATTPTSTVGLCLADGTPIAVTIVRDCTGAVTSEGWVNLTTGAYSAGAVPLGAAACGSSQSVQVSGTFCDVDDAGDVVGLVLIEYAYAADGTIEDVRLVDATTGGTYTPTGTITTCPAGVEQPERDVVQLCDTDGTVTAFVRDYARDENGQVTGHTDYTLDGEPYTVSGEVGVCADPVPPCSTSTTLTLCDSTPLDVGGMVTATVTDPTPYFQSGDGVTKRIVLEDLQPFYDGLGPGTVAGPAGGEPTPEPVHRYSAVLLTLPEDACPPCGDWPETLTLTVACRATNNGPAAGNAVNGRYTLFNGTTQLGENEIRNTPAGGFSDFSVSAEVTHADMVAGTIALKMDLETRHLGQKAWTLTDFTVTLDAEQTGCGTPFLRTLRRDCETGDLLDVTDTDYDGQPYTPVGDVAQCSPRSSCGSGHGASGGGDCQQCSPVVLCDVMPVGDPVPFMRTLCLDCSGAVVSVTDTTLDGTTPYTPSGTVVTDCAAVKDCPSTYGTECWKFVEAQVAYDNTASNCGTVLPGSMGACAGNWRITSWVIDGVEQITGAPAEFVSTGCGGAAGQFHGEWARVLGVIDPSSTWQPAYNGTCLHYIRTASVDPNRTYGQMVMFRTEAPTAVFTLGPAASRSETQYTKTYVQQCDGTTTVTWLDADGNELPAAPTEELVTCTSGTGGTGGAGFAGQTMAAGLLQDDEVPVETGVRSVTGTERQDLADEGVRVQSLTLHVLTGVVAVTMTDGDAVPIPAGVTATWSTAAGALAAAAFEGTSDDAAYLLTWTGQ